MILKFVHPELNSMASSLFERERTPIKMQKYLRYSTLKTVSPANAGINLGSCIVGNTA